MPRKTLIISTLYICFLILSFLYVKSVLKTQKLYQKDNSKPKIEKTWNVSASLIVYTESRTRNFKSEVKNTDSIMSFLEDIRNNQGLVFEKLSFTHGVEIDTLFNEKAPADYRWSVFMNGVDVTNYLTKDRVTDGAVYEIKLVKIND